MSKRMNEELSQKEQLNLETAIIHWKALEAFFAQGKLLIVAPSGDLVNTASIIAENNVTKLEKLINSQMIEFASPKWVRKHCTEETGLWAVVVSPYVLAQLQS
jgi:hypothetical protein